MPSPQEVLVNELSRWSFAAPFLFFPDKFLKGRSSRQPADLAWACNGCVLLMYMKDTVQDADWAVGKNLDQAAGWMREWTNGRLLTGRNAWHEFSIPHSADLNVVVLSVVKHGAYAHSYSELADKHKVRICAALPESAIRSLAHSGSSALDILVLLAELGRYSQRGPIPETQVQEIVRRHMIDSFKMAIENQPLHPGLPLLKRITATTVTNMLGRLVPLRISGTPTPRSPQPVGMSQLHDILADLYLAEMLFLAILAQRGINFARRTRSKKPSKAFAFSLANYDGILLILKSVPPDVDEAGIVEYVSRMFNEQIPRYGPRLVYDCDRNEMSLWCAERPADEPSRTQQLLTSLARR